MVGLVPATHESFSVSAPPVVGGQVRPGHDELGETSLLAKGRPNLPAACCKCDNHACPRRQFIQQDRDHVSRLTFVCSLRGILALYADLDSDLTSLLQMVLQSRQSGAGKITQLS